MSCKVFCASLIRGHGTAVLLGVRGGHLAVAGREARDGLAESKQPTMCAPAIWAFLNRGHCFPARLRILNLDVTDQSRQV